MKTKQLSYEERIMIEFMLGEKRSMRYIAKILHRSVSSISYEIKEKSVCGVYCAKKAHMKTYQRRWGAKKQCMQIPTHVYRKEIESWIKLKWSPERISGYLKVKMNVLVSKKSIYKFIHWYGLERYLLWKGGKRTKAYPYRHTKKDMEKKYIEARPLVYGSGHLEMDFIVSGHNTVSLLVIVDRYTRYVWIEKILNRKHATVLRALQNICGNMMVKSITTDNDIAFSAWKQWESILHTKIYFTYPYHAWEKGLVENTNRWIRVSIPKKTDIDTVSQEELQEIQTFLNTVPRQCIGFMSASELQLQATECSD
jgi:IS30 family transposase